MKIRPEISLMILSVLGLGSFVRADQITETHSFGIVTPTAQDPSSSKRTDYSTTLVFNQFNTSLGTLTRVDFVLNGHVEGDAGFENLSTSATAANQPLQLFLQATLTAQRPNGSTLASAIPVVSTSDSSVPAFDGDVKIDFAGPSGKTYGVLPGSPISANASSSASTTDPNDLTLFKGSGSITLPVIATGQSTYAGPTNVATFFDTFASGDFTITYNYTPNVVPEPSSLILLGTGVTGLIVVARRRSRRA